MHFLQGLILGISYLAPIGMQNLFLINTALAQTKFRIFLTVLIVTLTDMTLSTAAFFGMGALLNAFPLFKILILIIGGILLVYMGYNTIIEEANLEKLDTHIPIKKIITMSILVTWVNPQAIIDSSMLLGAFRASLSPSGALQFFLGVLVATPCWFGGLSAVVYALSHKITISSLTWINRICGSIITLYGLKLIFDGITSLF